MLVRTIEKDIKKCIEIAVGSAVIGFQTLLAVSVALVVSWV